MFLSGVFLGVSSFKQQISTPVRRAYNKIKVYGNATIDKLQIKNIEVDNTTLQNIIPTDTAVWDSNTILLAEFENNLGAGNITGVTDPITQWQIARTDMTTNVLKILNTQDVSQINYIDYSTQYGKSYQYEIFPLTNSQVAVPLQTSSVTNNAFGYFLIDKTQGLLYKFDLNAVSGDVSYEEDVTIYDTYVQYPAIAQGKRKYMKTSISALCGTIDINGQLQQPIDYIDGLKDFVLNSQQKIWKTRKGAIHQVYTRNFKYHTLDDGIGSQPMQVSFDVIEVADV